MDDDGFLWDMVVATSSLILYSCGWKVSSRSKFWSQKHLEFVVFMGFTTSYLNRKISYKF